MTDKQENAIRRLCNRHGVEFDADNYSPTFDLPSDYVAGWIGDSIYVGVDANGNISS